MVCEDAPRTLIETRLARETVELDATPEEEKLLLHGFSAASSRLRAGNRVMIYTDDAAPVIEWIHAHDGGERRPLVVRPTNLEDVFLSVTGTSLEEHP